MIPKIIWQTYECDYEDLPEYIKDCTKTWIDLNPEWEYRYINSLKRKEFVLNNYGEDWLNIFNNLPNNVMMANMWSYMVLNSFGGLYVDIDTVCKKPINYWLDNNFDLVCSTEFVDEDPKKDINVFIFAGKKNNIVFEKMFKSINNKLKDIGYSIEKHSDISGYIAFNDVMNSIPNLFDIYSIDVFYGDRSKIIHEESVDNLRASFNWKDNYISWRNTKEIVNES
jgi:mannosyltransferase OCH1-like enzyme